MSRHMKFGIAGIIIGLILFFINPWLAIGVIVAAVAIPAVLWAMLDPSQRRRLRNTRGRKQIGG
jgi:membrane protein implicated in regulation of membrane protease activity